MALEPELQEAVDLGMEAAKVAVKKLIEDEEMQDDLVEYTLKIREKVIKHPNGVNGVEATQLTAAIIMSRK